MQNNEEELRGLEEKLGRLAPRDLDESQLESLTSALENNGGGAGGGREDMVYPSNVLWMRFAPVAAAAGVVLLGTFLLRYESRREAIQAQQENSGNGASVLVSSDARSYGQDVPVGNGGVIQAAGVNTAVTSTLPVPRLGVGEDYNGISSSAGAGLLPVSGQSYLQPMDEVFGEFNRGGSLIPGSLHFEDAYDWQEADDPRADEASQQSRSGSKKVE